MSEQHTDKCCSWDDPDFCDCGEREHIKLTAELAQLREDLARAEGEREAYRKSADTFSELMTFQQERAEAAEQERDTLKAECGRLNAQLVESVADVDTLKAGYQRLNQEIHSLRIGNQDANAVISRQAGMLADLRAQLTQAEEAHKLAAVQMMGLEEERERLEVELSESRGKQNSLIDGLQAAFMEKLALQAQITTFREEGYRAGQQWGLKWLRANWSADWGKTCCDMEEAIARTG